jgi:hypothetical protein
MLLGLYLGEAQELGADVVLAAHAVAFHRAPLVLHGVGAVGAERGVFLVVDDGGEVGAVLEDGGLEHAFLGVGPRAVGDTLLARLVPFRGEVRPVDCLLLHRYQAVLLLDTHLPQEVLRRGGGRGGGGGESEEDGGGVREGGEEWREEWCGVGVGRVREERREEGGGARSGVGWL